MKSLYIPHTSKSPTINFDPKAGVFEIYGRSIPENSVEFYKPVMAWMDRLRESKHNDIILVVKLEYFNTSSSKCLVDIFRKLEKSYLDGHSVKIQWYYEEEDDDMRESGEDIKEILKMPVEMISFVAED
ncbi:MAG: DUF1987 domain-containing protein [Cyclobacteriaceae bacterium]